MLVEQLGLVDTACKFQSTRILRRLDDRQLQLYKYIDTYMGEYCDANNLSIEAVLAAKEKFTKRYLNDLAHFSESGHYPVQPVCTTFTLTRIEYDIVLILSFLLERHRFAIADWLAQQHYSGSILSVGIGPGVELGIITEYLGNKVSLLGFDLDVSPYVMSRYDDMIKKEHFSPGSECFDFILLIEILEHLVDPTELLNNTISVLKQGGRMLLTTAIDMPQFDHVYNFTPEEIKEMLAQRNMTCTELITITHQMNTHSVTSKNELVVAQRKQ